MQIPDSSLTKAGVAVGASEYMDKWTSMRKDKLCRVWKQCI